MDLHLLWDWRTSEPPPGTKELCAKQNISFTDFSPDELPPGHGQSVGLVIGPRGTLYTDFLEYCEKHHIPVLVFKNSSDSHPPMPLLLPDHLSVPVVLIMQARESAEIVSRAHYVLGQSLEAGRHELEHEPAEKEKV